MISVLVLTHGQLAAEQKTLLVDAWRFATLVGHNPSDHLLDQLNRFLSRHSMFLLRNVNI